MENFPKVLVGCPTYEGMNYCLAEFINRIKELTYKNYKILIVDNSDKGEFFEKLKKIEGIELIRDTNGKTNMDKLVNSRNRIIDFALMENYEFILMLDQDVIPPKNVIEELLACNKDVVSALYYNYFMSGGRGESLPVAWMPVTKEEFEEMKKRVTFPSSVKSNLDLRRHITEEEASSGNVLEVMHPSAGCILIKRKVFEKIRYGLLDLGGINAKTSDDIFFIKKASEQGFRIYCNTNVRCDHLVAGKFIKGADGSFYNPIYK